MFAPSVGMPTIGLISCLASPVRYERTIANRSAIAANLGKVLPNVMPGKQVGISPVVLRISAGAVHFGIERFELARPAMQEQKDDRLILHRPTCSRLRLCREQAGQRESAGRQTAHLQERASAERGSGIVEREHGGNSRRRGGRAANDSYSELSATINQARLMVLGEIVRPLPTRDGLGLNERSCPCRFARFASFNFVKH